MKKYTALYQSGFTLLEVMIAAVIFSIGLLGLASLQVISLKLTSDSLLRTVAAVQANDMIDRMRANSSATLLGINSPYNNPTGAATANPNCLGMNSTGGELATAQCTSTQMAGEDFYEWNAAIGGAPASGWQSAISAQLPSGSGIVCIDSTPNDGQPGAPACDNIVTIPDAPIFAIKIWWLERKDTNNPGAFHRYVTSFSL